MRSLGYVGNQVVNSAVLVRRYLVQRSPNNRLKPHAGSLFPDIDGFGGEAWFGHGDVAK